MVCKTLKREYGLRKIFNFYFYFPTLTSDRFETSCSSWKQAVVGFNSSLDNPNTQQQQPCWLSEQAKRKSFVEVEMAPGDQMARNLYVLIILQTVSTLGFFLFSLFVFCSSRSFIQEVSRLIFFANPSFTFEAGNNQILVAYVLLSFIRIEKKIKS